MHKAKACIVTCIDFRFQKQIQKWIEENGYLGNSDEIIAAGTCRDIVKPLEQFHKDALMRQIDLSNKLHDPDEIIIIDHQDCGGFAQDGTIPAGLTTDEDKAKHAEHAATLKTILEEKFPGKTIKHYYARLEEGDVVELN